MRRYHDMVSCPHYTVLKPRSETTSRSQRCERNRVVFTFSQDIGLGSHESWG